MLYIFAHFLRDRIPFIWNIIESINSFLFSIIYGKKMKLFKFSIPHDGYNIVPISEVNTNDLVDFFSRQPEDSFKFFKPHEFTYKAIKKLQCNKSFLAYVLVNNNCIVGYCFNRSFFNGKAFRGRMVDINYRGNGLGIMMNRILNEVGFGIGLRLFETVNKENVASYRSALSASNVKIIKEMDNNDLFLEILKD